MNQVTVKALLACFCAAVFFLFNLSYKSSHNGISYIDSFISAKNVDNLSYKQINRQLQEPVIKSPTIADKNHIASVNCIVYGPINSDNKNVVDMLLNKANITGLFTSVEKPVYEIYWNLGKDKVKAIELFEAQKNEGPLQDEKYKISLNSDNDWVVSISKIIADEVMAKNFTTNLAIKANKIQTGGRWQYKNTSTVYFYQTDNSSNIPNEVNGVLEKTFSINKSKCV